MGDEPADCFFKSICVDMGAALIATDEQFRIRFWNVAAGRLFGESSEAMLGRPLTAIVPEARQGLIQKLLTRAITRGEARELEFRHTDPEGRDLYLAATISPIQGDHQQGIGVSVCIRDVTRGMEMLRDVAEAQRMSALALMAGAVAHHFNNTLGGIITTIDFAQVADSPELLRRTLRMTAAALRRATSRTSSGGSSPSTGRNGPGRTSSSRRTCSRSPARYRSAA